jgi:hypothetical protein
MTANRVKTKSQLRRHPGREQPCSLFIPLSFAKWGGEIGTSSEIHSQLDLGSVFFPDGRSDEIRTASESTADLNDQKRAGILLTRSPTANRRTRRNCSALRRSLQISFFFGSTFVKKYRLYDIFRS